MLQYSLLLFLINTNVLLSWDSPTSTITIFPLVEIFAWQVAVKHWVLTLVNLTAGITSTKQMNSEYFAKHNCTVSDYIWFVFLGGGFFFLGGGGGFDYNRDILFPSCTNISVSLFHLANNVTTLSFFFFLLFLFSFFSFSMSPVIVCQQVEREKPEN